MPAIVILKTGQTIPAIAVRYGDFEDWIIAGSGQPPSAFRTVAIDEGEILPPLDAVSAVIVTGSPAMVTDDLPWIRAGEQYLRDVVSRGIPVLGICFGHQMLAQALGGKVDYHPRGREIGTTTVALTPAAKDDALFAGLPAAIPVHVTHMQSVTSLPPAAHILAGNDFDPHHAVRFAESAWGVQFHPEFDARIMAAYINERESRIREEGLDVERLAAEVREAEVAAGLLRRFAEIVTSDQPQ
jgi:GMP synthase (glutamine-hydrolysing)